MEKAEFKKIVDKLNTVMRKNKLSLNKALKELNIPDSTYYDNIKEHSNEFKYDKRIKQIIQINTGVIIEGEPVQGDDTDVINSVEETVTNMPIVKNADTPITSPEAPEWKEKFEEMYQWYLTKKDTPEPLVIDLEQFEGTADYKTIKMYPNVLEKLEKYTKRHKQYKMQDIINAAVLEFMTRHK